MFRSSRYALALLCLAPSSLPARPGSDAFAPPPPPPPRGAGRRHGRRSGTTVAFASPPPAPPSSSAAAFVPAPLRRTFGRRPLPMSNDGESGGGSSTLVRGPDSSVVVTIPVPGAATRAAYDRACSDASKQMSVPGFRRGAKIPPAVIESALASSGGGGRNALREQAVNSLVSKLVEPTLRDEHGVEPIGQPVLDPGAEALAETFVPGEPIDLVVKCDVWPDIEWKDVPGQEKAYLGLKGTYKRKPFNQERFDRALIDLRERYATLSPAEEGAVLEMGDACVVDMVGYMAGEDGVSKGEPLPDTASGDNVEVVLGEGRYMEGLVEGLVGAKVGETKTVYVSFPMNLRDKTLAGKRAVFDVTVKEASHRSIPDVTDEFASKVREGLTAESLKEELRKAVDSEDAKEFVNERNEALGEALASVLDVEVPDTLVTQQAREKFAMMMTDFRDQGMDDDDIKKQITPENFLKYKDISRDGIVRDFRISMAVDEIARLEGIDVPAHSVDEQMEAVRKEAAEAGQADDMDEAALRSKVEATLQRRLVFDYLAEHADLDIEYTDGGGETFDPELLAMIAEESLAREKGISVEEARQELEGEESVDSAAAEEKVKAAEEKEAAAQEEAQIAAAEKKAAEEEAEKSKARATAEAEAEEDLDAKYSSMDLEDRAFAVLSDLGILERSPDPDDPDYDGSADDELAPENVFPPSS